MSSAQLDFADLVVRGAAELTREAPSLAAAPAVASRLARVLGARLPCQAVIHWACPVCSTRTVTRWRCGPRCATCSAGAPASASLLRQIPQVPVRHWVLSLPSPQRFDFAGDARSEAAIVKAFMHAVFARLRAQGGDRSAGCGAVAAIHRSGAALNLNLHIHALVVDGVFHRSPDGSNFAAQAPGPEDLAIVAQEVNAALARLPASDIKDPALATLQQAARPRRKINRASQRRSGNTFDLGGLKVFAGLPVAASDRAALRRLCDYVTRTASARLAMATSGPHIATHPELGAHELVARLVAATPAEPAVSVRTYGVLAPRAAHLWQLCHGHQLELPAMPCAEPRRLARARSPRCARCDVALAAFAVEDASDPPARGT
ncbi:transposase [Nannocystis sp.]|uniref:transposase n=1 Tax=Nannocystis sp. TaxID=1962667 RepID=UPI0025EA0370|nr:transposase [Nannocystis sp.]MBK7827245.1 transposase [Nannocystis sp.]